MRTAIYGGSFNPIHNAHLHLLRSIQEQMNFDRLFLIPAGIPPHKSAGKLAGAAERIEMCNLARSELSMPVHVLDLEVRREGKSYTAETLRLLSERYPQDRFTLIMGEDMFRTLGTWWHHEEIFRLAEICAVKRSEEGDAAMAALAKEYEKEGAVCHIVKAEFLDISSTAIREMIQNGEEISSLVPETVAAYIFKNGLYKDDPVFEAYRLEIRKRLSDARYYHSLCVAKAAKSLAKRYGADAKKAELAGVLHDILKDTPKEEQLQFAQRFGIILDNFELASKTLLHAKVGAAFLERELGVSDPEILDAVRYHTTGKADMSLLTRIIFTADFISDDREYPGVEQMRSMAASDLREAMLEGLAFTISELTEKRRVIHPDTIRAYNALIFEKEGTTV